MKKVIAVILSAVTLLSVLCACGEKETPTDTLLPETENDGTIDFYGYNYIIGSVLRNGNNELYPESGATAVGDKLLKHYSDTESKYNCKITNFVTEYFDMNEAIMKAAAVSEVVCDVVNGWYQYMFELYNADMLLPLEDFKCFSDLYSGKWGYENWINATERKGEHYGFIANNWGIPVYQAGLILFFNPEYISEAGATSPFEYMEKNNWVWDSFESELKALRCTNDDGLPAGSLNATESYYSIISAILSNGCRFITQDSTGKYVTDIGDNAVQAMDWFTRLCNEGTVINNRDKGGLSLDSTFQNRETAYACLYSYHGTVDSLAYEEGLKVSWAPFPCGPQGTYGDWGSAILHGSLYFSMPDNEHKGVYEKDTVDELTGLLFEPFEGEDGTEWLDYYNTMFFFDDYSFNNYMQMIKDAKDIHYDVLLYQNISFLQVQSGKVSPTSAIEKVIGQIEKNIDIYLNN